MTRRKNNPRSGPDLAEASLEVQPSAAGQGQVPGASAAGDAPAGETLSAEAAAMLADLKGELDEAIAARKRALADFANYQRRALDNEQRAGRNATAAMIRSLLGVLDHFDLALGQDPGQVTVEQLLRGVRMVRDELDAILERHGVSRIEPQVGEEFDPTRHEAVMRQATPEVPPGHVASVLQAGYALGDVVLRPARVVVAAEDEEGR